MARRICFAQGTVICPLCGCQLMPNDQVIREHLHPLALGGGDDEGNMAYVHRACADRKTNGSGPKATTYGSDKHAIAKAKRLAAERAMREAEAAGEKVKRKRKAKIPQPTKEQRRAQRERIKEWVAANVKEKADV